MGVFDVLVVLVGWLLIVLLSSLYGRLKSVVVALFAIVCLFCLLIAVILVVLWFSCWLHGLCCMVVC